MAVESKENVKADADRAHIVDWEQIAPVVREFTHDPTFVTGYFGPLGCGKTAAGAMKSWLYGQAWPGANIAIIRTTWPRLRDTTQKEVFKWFPPGVTGTYDITPKTMHLHTGVSYGTDTTVTNEPTHLMFRALDDQKDIEDVLSLSLAAAWVDEPQGGLSPVGKTLENEPGLDHTLFLHLLSRLGRQPGYRRMCWLTGNPPDPQHWIAKEFQYHGQGAPKNADPRFHLYLGAQDTNRRHLYHHYVGDPSEGECRLCGQAFPEIIHQQGDYYEEHEALFGHGTPLALRFIHGLWVPLKSLRPFSAEWIQYVSDLPANGRPAVAGCFNVLGVDPAISKRDEGCRSSITLAGVPRQGLYRAHRIVWRNLSDHWSPYELCDKILEWLERFPVKRLRIESNGWQGALGDIVQREAKLRGTVLPHIDLVQKRTDKLLGAMQWSGSVETGHILFDPSCKNLIECMLDVPMNKMAWDPVDATGLALSGIPMKHARATALPKAADETAKKRAASYAVKVETGHRQPMSFLHLRSRMTNATLKARARGYAMRA